MLERLNDNNRGCGGCHASTPNTTRTQVTFEGPTTLVAGARGQYTLTVVSTYTLSGSTVTGAGAFVGADKGVLVPSDEMTLFEGALFHKAPKLVEEGKTVFRFELTAPAEPGVIQLRGLGLAMNGNNAQTFDAWNHATPVEVTVTAAPTPPGPTDPNPPNPPTPPAPPTPTNPNPPSPGSSGGTPPPAKSPEAYTGTPDPLHADDEVGCTAVGGSLSSLTVLLAGLLRRRRKSA